MHRWFCGLASIVVCLGVLGRAQQPVPPPNVITIFEENVKVGKEPAHEKLETNWARASAAAKWPGSTVAMKAIAGPPQAWYVTGFGSMAEVEQVSQAQDKHPFSSQNDVFVGQDADMLSSARRIIATYREDLSYLPANSVPVPKLRYFDVEIFQVRPGHLAEFVESRKLNKAAHEKASMPDGLVLYAVVSGAPNGTFLRFRGLQSLADEDRYAQAHTAKAYQDAASATQKRVDELTSASVATIQQLIFQFDPKMSYMPKEFTSGDPDFWTPKPRATASAAPPAGAPAAGATKPKQ
jgi:hypothetical protein